MSAANDRPASTTAPTPKVSALSESTAAANDVTAGAVAASPQERPTATMVVGSPCASKLVVISSTKKRKKRPLADGTEPQASANDHRHDRDRNRALNSEERPIPAPKKKTAVGNDTQTGESSSSQAKNKCLKTNHKTKRFSSILSGMKQSKKKKTDVLVEREALRKRLGGGNFAKVDKI